MALPWGISCGLCDGYISWFDLKIIFFVIVNSYFCGINFNDVLLLLREVDFPY